MKSQLFRASCALAPFALALTASPVSATTVIEAFQVFEDSDNGVGRTQITVRGNRQRYTRVGTRKVSFWVRLKGHAPARSDGHQGSSLTIGGYKLDFDEPGPAPGQVYRGQFDYQPPRNGSFDAVLFCNGKLGELSGDARKAFLREGRIYSLRNAYSGQLRSSWMVRPQQSGIFSDPPRLETWENSTEIIAQIKCAPLDPNAGATRTNPERPPQRTNPTPPDPSTLPRLRTATLAISPYAIQQVNGDRCPTKLRLRGFIETNRAMKGKVIFVGPQYLSSAKEFDFNGAKTMNHIGNYTIKWGGGGSDTLSMGIGAAQRQDLSFKFNVVNRRGRLVKSVTKSIRVTCER